MRKILLTSVTLFGASVASDPVRALDAPVAANPSQGQLATPYGAGPAANNNNNAWGAANTASGSAAAGPTSTIFAPNVDAAPKPGTVVIRLNGRVEVDLSADYTSLDKGYNANGRPNGYKLNPLGITSFMRVYPAFDGLAANGLRYGASVELRENVLGGNNIQNYGSTPNTTFSTASSPSANSSGQTVFVRRAFTYLASDQAGIVRFGQGDGVIGLLDNCVFTTQCWDAGITVLNGFGLQDQAPQGAVAVPFVWLSQAGSEYANNKVVYLSPQFFGFDFGVQYAPNQGNAFQNGAGGNGIQPLACQQAGQNCISDSSGGDAQRWLNQVGVGLRYQHAFGPVDVKAYGFYETAGKENLVGTGFGAAAPGYQPTTRTGSVASFRYDNLNFYTGGVAVTAYNVTAAADYIGGAVNGQLQMRPTGGAPTNAVLTGLTYSKGPVILGAEIGLIDTQGDARLTGISQRHEYEVAFGGNYKLAPGVQLVGVYEYTHRHQGGYDFAQGALGVNAAGTNPGSTTRDAQAQGLMFSTVLTW